MQQRGFTRPAKLAVGGRCAGLLVGAVGGLSADPQPALLDAQDRQRAQLFPEVQAHCLRDALPKAKQGPHEIWMAETRAAAERAFGQGSSVTSPKAAACLARDREELLAFYDFPAAHWTRLRTTNVIGSAFATIRHRSSRAKGCVTRRTMLSMICKMSMSTEQSRRRLRGVRQLGKVIEGGKFADAIEVIQDGRAAA